MNKIQKQILEFLKQMRTMNLKKLENLEKTGKVDELITKKEGELIFSNKPFMYISPSDLSKKFNFDSTELNHHLLYLSEKGYISFTEWQRPGEGREICITAKGIDALQPWWI